MITKYFDRDSPFLWIVWPFIVIILWIPSFITDTPLLSSTTNHGLISNITNQLIALKWLAIIITILIVITQGYLLKYITSKHALIKSNSFYIPLIYCLTLSIFQFDIILNPYLITATLLLIAINKMLDLGKEETNNFKVFEASLIIGFTGILYYPMLYFILLTWISLFLFKTFSFKEWIQPFVGVTLPLLYLAVYWYWNDSLTDEFTTFKNSIFNISFFDKNEASVSSNITRFWILGVIALSAKTYFNQLRNNIMRTKYGHLFFVWIVAICLVIASLSVISMTSFFIATTMIVSTFYGVFANHSKRKIIPELLIWIGVLLIIINFLSSNNYL